MKLWQAWLASVVTLYTTFRAVSNWGLLDSLSDQSYQLLSLAMGVLCIVITPIVAHKKNRRWWLWLILGIVLDLFALFAVGLAERYEATGPSELGTEEQDSATHTIE